MPEVIRLIMRNPDITAWFDQIGSAHKKRMVASFNTIGSWAPKSRGNKTSLLCFLDDKGTVDEFLNIFREHKKCFEEKHPMSFRVRQYENRSCDYQW